MCKQMGLQNDDEPTPQTNQNPTKQQTKNNQATFNSNILINDIPVDLDPKLPQHRWNAPFELMHHLHTLLRSLKLNREVDKSQLTTYDELAIEFEIAHQIQIETNATNQPNPL